MKKPPLDYVAEFIRSVHAHRERGLTEQHSGTVVVTSGKSLVLDDLQHRLFAIALETALLPIQDVELNYRLALRASEILGGTRAQRLENRRTIRDSYNVRSKIVHSGSYEVTDDSHGRLRWMTKRILLGLVIKRRLWTKTSKDLDNWLEGLTLR